MPPSEQLIRQNKSQRYKLLMYATSCLNTKLEYVTCRLGMRSLCLDAILYLQSFLMPDLSFFVDWCSLVLVCLIGLRAFVLHLQAVPEPSQCSSDQQPETLAAELKIMCTWMIVNMRGAGSARRLQVPEPGPFFRRQD